MLRKKYQFFGPVLVPRFTGLEPINSLSCTLSSRSSKRGGGALAEWSKLPVRGYGTTIPGKLLRTKIANRAVPFHRLKSASLLLFKSLLIFAGRKVVHD